MPTLSEIRDFARQQTLLDVDDIDNSKLNNIINEGVREVASRFNWPFLTANTTLSFTADQRSESLPAAVRKIEVVILDGGKRLAELPASSAWTDYGDEFKSGTPRQFFLWGDDIYLVPYPDTAVTLDIYYYTAPTALANDTDEPGWADRFHMVLADYAIWRLWEREEDFRKAAQAQAVFGQRVEQMARHYMNRANDAPLVFGQPQATRKRNYRSFISGIDA